MLRLQHFTQTNHILYIVTGSLLFALSGFLMLNLLHPFTIDSAYADSKNTAISLRIGESIMLPEVSTDSINIELDPTAANGDFKTASVTVGVSTNRTAGYTLTASVEGSETALTNVDYDNYEIAALSNKTSADDFADLTKTASMNKWGYATDNNGTSDGQTEASYYYAMPDVDNPTTLKITDGPAATSNTEVTFATKGKDLAAGKYENTVVFTAIGNLEAETRTLDDLEYMQDVGDRASEICENSTLYSEGSREYTLKDSRNSQSYKIRKLDDDKCWMVQNLYLTGGTKIAYDKSDFESITITGNGTGEYTLPFSTSGGSTFSDSSTSDMNNGSATTGSYYSWPVATAGTGSAYGSDTNNIPTSSICPKGWKLPTGGSGGEFETLYNKYDSASSFTESWNFTEVGRYWIGSIDFTKRAYYWSRIGFDNNSTYVLSMDSTSVAGSGSTTYYNKYHGCSVRCVLGSS